MLRLRFALLHDDAGLERWHERCLAELEPHAELTEALASPAAHRPARRSPGLRWYARRVGGRSMGGAPGIPSATDQRTSEPPDFVLALGHVDVPPRLAEAPLGVWRFAHELDGDELPFFSEVYAGEPLTRAALLAVTPAGASVLQEGVFRTDTRSYLPSRTRIQDAIAAWPARACLRVGDDGLGALPPAVLPAASGARRAGGLPGFAGRVVRRRLALAWQRFFRHPQWNVGVLRRPIDTLLAPGEYTGEEVDWLPLRDKSGFLADPFGVVRDGRLHIFCERFDYREGRGRICAVELGNGVAEEHADALPLPVHASYPCLLDLQDGLYCIPETSDGGEVALYRASEVRGPWEKVAVLLDGFAGVDPTVFRQDGRWWLMCTCKGAQEDAELLVWHAPELRGPWTPHERNPVKTDVRSARPAGPPFVHEGVLYRPAQDCSETYGGRVTLQRVTRLEPMEFAEETVAVLEASPRSPFPIGPHTLTAVGDIVLVDGRRTVFVWAAFLAFLRIWARAVAKKLRPGR